VGNYFKILLKLLPLIAIPFFSCSSGEYDIEEYNIKYTETSLKIDTIRKADTTQIVKHEEQREEFTKPVKYSYVVQIGAYSIRSNYERFIQRARQVLGSEVYDTFENNLYKIRIGKFFDKGEALKLLEKVKGLGFYDAFVITTKQ
jgi:cell division septation protein DedD